MRGFGHLVYADSAPADSRQANLALIGPSFCKRKAVLLHYTNAKWAKPMSRVKDETLSIRTSAEIKQLLRIAAEREHRSIASMIEVLILDHAARHGLSTSASASETGGESAK